MKNKIPNELKHDWQVQDSTSDRGKRWWCPNCKSWTGNLPLYKDDICEAKDRRSGNDRRSK